MRVAILKAGPLDASGISRVVASWCRMLRRAGSDVTVVAQPSPDAPVELRGVSLRHPPALAGTGRTAPLREGAAVAALVEELHRQRGLDVVLSHSSILTVHVRRRLPRIPILQTFHSPFVEENRLDNWKYARSAWRRLTYPATRIVLAHHERRALRSVSLAHTLSGYTWDLLRARFPAECGRAPHVVVPGTYDDGLFRPAADRRAVRAELGLPADETLLLAVRRLVPRNGVDRILGAASALRDTASGVRFLVAGDGPSGPELREQLRKERLDGTVRMLGFVPDARLAGLYQAADALLMPSRELECFGLPIVEAMGCGTPPLAMPEGGPAEICRELPGLLAAANTDEAFIDLVRRFLRGEIEVDRTELASRARECFSERALEANVVAAVERASTGS